MWKVKIKVTLTVVDALGTVPKCLGGKPEVSRNNDKCELLQKTALFGTAHILRRVLGV